MEARSRLQIERTGRVGAASPATLAFWLAHRWAAFAWLVAASVTTAFVDVPRGGQRQAPPLPEALPQAPRSQDPPPPPADEPQEEVDPSEQVPA